MDKKEALKKWTALPKGLPILPHFSPIPYKSRGSNYGACGIRIDGNPEFIRAVLSRLQDLTAGENHLTRLGLAWSDVDGSGIGKDLPNAERAAQVCYIRLHQRGREATGASLFFDRNLDGATELFMEAHA